MPSVIGFGVAIAKGEFLLGAKLVRREVFENKLPYSVGGKPCPLDEVGGNCGCDGACLSLVLQLSSKDPEGASSVTIR